MYTLQVLLAFETKQPIALLQNSLFSNGGGQNEPSDSSNGFQYAKKKCSMLLTLFEMLVWPGLIVLARVVMAPIAHFV